MKIKNLKKYVALFGLTTAISLNSLTAFAKGIENDSVIEVQEDENDNSKGNIVSFGQLKKGIISVRKEEKAPNLENKDKRFENQAVKEEGVSQEREQIKQENLSYQDSQKEKNTSVSYSFIKKSGLSICINCEENSLDDTYYDFINNLLVENPNIGVLFIHQSDNTLDFSKLNIPSNIWAIDVDFQNYEGGSLEFELNSEDLLSFSVVFNNKNKDNKTIENLKINGANNLNDVNICAKSYIIEDFSVSMSKEAYMNVTSEFADLSVLKELELSRFTYIDKNDERWTYDVSECSEDFKEFISDLEAEMAKNADTGYGFSFKPKN